MTGVTLPGLDELLEHHQTISRVLHGSEGMQLVHEWGHDHQLGEVAQAPEPAMARRSVLIVADQDVCPSGVNARLRSRHVWFPTMSRMAS